MPAIKNISIPTPCHQSWQQMQPNDTGRHCNQCAKTVTDFSRMTNEQVILYLSTSTAVCGRFAPFQLENINQKIEAEDNPVGWKRWVMVLGLFGSTLFLKAGAQTKANTPHLTQQDTTRRPDSRNFPLGKIAVTDPPATKVITGRVTDENGQPIIGASVCIRPGKVGVMTDITGNFKLRLPVTEQHFAVMYIGYYSQDIVINAAAGLAYQVKMQEVANVLGEIAVVKKAPFVALVYHRYIRRPFRAIFKHKKHAK